MSLLYRNYAKRYIEAVHLLGVWNGRDKRTSSSAVLDLVPREVGIVLYDLKEGTIH